jgi:hypothetical protein
MQRFRLALLAFLMVGLAGISQGQDAKKKAGKAAGAPTVEGKSLGNGVFTGVVKDPPEGNRVVIRQIPTPKSVQPAPVVAKGKGKAPATGQAKSDPTEFAFTVATGAPVVFRVMPEAFDDKGEIVKPTADQLQRLRSSGLPGKLEQIRTGMVLRLTQAGEKVNRVEVISEVDQPLSKQAKTPATPKKK